MLSRNQMATAHVELKRASASTKMTEMDHSLFTVARNQSTGESTKQIRFAQSNLAYYGKEQNNKWRLMQYPWSTIETNGDFVPAADSTFSLFGWATSGFEGCNPWKSDYGAAADSTYGPSQLTEDYQSWTTKDVKWDWGRNNQIYDKDGNTALTGTWHVPSLDEWNYIMDLGADRRAKVINGKSYVHTENLGTSQTTYIEHAIVANINGIIFLPDYYIHPSGIDVSSNISSENWEKMQKAGAIFLPEAGYRIKNQVAMLNSVGWYWTSNNGHGSEAFRTKCATAINVIQLNEKEELSRSDGCSVRLVQDVN